MLPQKKLQNITFALAAFISAAYIIGWLLSLAFGLPWIEYMGVINYWAEQEYSDPTYNITTCLMAIALYSVAFYASLLGMGLVSTTVTKILVLPNTPVVFFMIAIVYIYIPDYGLPSNPYAVYHAGLSFVLSIIFLVLPIQSWVEYDGKLWKMPLFHSK
ncbi:hypothetical protein D5R81_00875 [Parashewanella spongiae]|uniref:Uncharacterized protein n=1 Tax=Parashewanella spongiae TaxID=342950 RepID=A0A3A6U5U0_9GAMM|nr:hypothetical protein [Parashewanella spongiae]MCL1078686.1 hypothetical protein [Parashewanella spongiae]RJY19405.1 hypothetical protein D5R81_00875 [Parashewanella spongiae]